LRTSTEKKAVVGFAIVLVVLMFCFSLFVAQAQTTTSFTRADQFGIPDNNGNISFSRNGTYQTAYLANGAWTFSGLRASNFNTTVNVTISVQNCNMTISSCSLRMFAGSPSTVSVSYNVKGAGTQSFNFGSYLTGGSWFVSLNRNTLLQGQGWSKKSDGTILVTGAGSNGNVTATYYFPYVDPSTRNQTFFQNHSIVIGTGIAIVIACFFALIVRQISVKKQRETLASETVNKNRIG
jgi:hypothetical protein